jgi:hypothetical protein
MDAVYEDSTKGPNARLGRVEYLSLEREGTLESLGTWTQSMLFAASGTVFQWHLVTAVERFPGFPLPPSPVCKSGVSMLLAGA